MTRNNVGVKLRSPMDGYVHRQRAMEVLKFHWDQFPRNFPVANVTGKLPTSYVEVGHVGLVSRKLRGSWRLSDHLDKSRWSGDVANKSVRNLRGNWSQWNLSFTQLEIDSLRSVNRCCCERNGLTWSHCGDENTRRTADFSS